MQKYISLFFSVLLFLTACQSQELPKGVLNEKDMLSLLLDVHLTDGEVYQIPQVPDSLYKYTSAKYVAVFKRHNTTDGVFKKSLQYYTKQPEQMQAMYTKLEAIIKAKVDSLNKATAAAAAKSAKSKPVKKADEKKADTVVIKKPVTTPQNKTIKKDSAEALKHRLLRKKIPKRKLN